MTLFTLLTSSSFFLTWTVFFWFYSWAFLNAFYFFKFYFLANNNYLILWFLSLLKLSLSSFSFLFNSNFCNLNFLISSASYLICEFWTDNCFSIFFCYLTFFLYSFSSVSKLSIFETNLVFSLFPSVYSFCFINIFFSFSNRDIFWWYYSFISEISSYSMLICFFVIC